QIVVREGRVAIVDPVLLPSPAVPEHGLVDIVVGDHVAAAAGVQGHRLVVVDGDVVLDEAGGGANADHDSVRLSARILVRRAVRVRVADHAPVASGDTD